MRKTVFLLVLILLVLIAGFVYQVMYNIIGGPKLYPTTYISLAGTPKAINFAQGGKYLYVTHGNNLFSKVNLSNNRVVSTIVLNGAFAFESQPITLGGNTYVSTALKNYTLLVWNNGTVVKLHGVNLSNWERTNHFSGEVETVWTLSNVFVVNGTSDTVVAAAQVPGYVEEMIPGKGNKFIYILSLNQTGFNGTLGIGTYGKSFFTVLDTQTNKVTATFLVGKPGEFGSITDHMFLDPDGNIYLNGINQTYIFNTSTNAFTEGTHTNSFTITGSPDGKYIYMTPNLGQVLYIINASTNKIVKQVPFENSAILSITVSQSGKYIYVSRWDQNVTVILNATSESVVKEIKINNPFGVSFSSNPKYAYIWSGGSTSADVLFNTITNNEVAHFVVPLSAQSLTADPFYYQNGNYSYDMSLGSRILVYNSNPNYIIFLTLLNYALAVVGLILIAFVSVVILRQNRKFG